MAAKLPQQVEDLARDVGLTPDRPVVVLKELCEELGLPREGSLPEQADRCRDRLGSGDMPLCDKVQTIRRSLMLQSDGLGALAEASRLLMVEEETLHGTADMCLQNLQKNLQCQASLAVKEMAEDVGLGEADQGRLGRWLGLDEDPSHQFLEACKRKIGQRFGRPLWEKAKKIDQAGIRVDMDSAMGLYEAALQLLESVEGKSLHQLADLCLEALGESVEQTDGERSSAALDAMEEDVEQKLSRQSFSTRECSESSMGDRVGEWQLIGKAEAHVDLAHLYDLVATSQEAIQRLAGKEVLLLWGGSCAGKTTLIYFVAGKTLERRHYKGPDGIPKVVYAPKGGEELPGFVLGHSQSASGTMSIASWQHPQSGKVYVDEPGDFDTRGVEIDIATVVCHRKIAETCAALRVAFVLRCDWINAADRGKHFRDLCRSLAHSVTNFARHSKLFCFVFNRLNALECFNGDPAVPVESRMADLQEELLARTNDILQNTPSKDSARQVLQCLVEALKSERKGESILLFHPEWCTPQEFQKLLESHHPEHWSSQPANVIQCRLTDAQEGMLSRHFKKCHVQLESDVAQGKFLEVGQQIGQLRGIARFTELSELLGNLELAVDLVRAELRRRRDSADAQIQAGTSDDKSAFTAAQAKEVLEEIEIIEKLAAVIAEGQQLDMKGSMCLDIKESLLALADQVYQECGSIESRKSIPLRVQEIRQRLVKLQAWKDAREDFGPSYKAACQAVAGFTEAALQLGERSKREGLPLNLCAALHLRHLSEAQGLTSVGLRLEEQKLKALAELCYNDACECLEAAVQQGAGCASRLLSLDGTDAKTDDVTVLQSCFEAVAQAKSDALTWPADAGEMRDYTAHAWTRLIEAMNVAELAAAAYDHFSRGGAAELLCGFFARLGHVLAGLPHDVLDESGAKEAWNMLLRQTHAGMRDTCSRLSVLLQQLLQQGYVCVDTLLALLRHLRNMAWLDEYLEEWFLQPTLAEVEEQLSSVVHRASREHATAVEKFLVDWDGRADLTRDSLDRLISVARDFPNLQKVEEDLRRQLTSVIQNWLARYVGRETLAGREVHELLLAKSRLPVADFSEELLAELARAEAQLVRTAQELQQLFASDGRFEEKDRAILLAQEWADQRLSMVSSAIISPEEMRRRVRDEMDQLVAAVQELIADSAGAAESKLAGFQHVSTLSDAVWSKVHVQIASLAESIRLRTEDVGKELSEATALFNFGPVRKYLIPNDASDQRQIDKCNARLQSVARCVQAMVRTAQDVLSSPADFTDRFDKLKIARQDVGDLLPGVDIEAELAAMKDHANAEFQKLCTASTELVQHRDLPGFFKTRKTLRLARGNLEALLTAVSVAACENALCSGEALQRELSGVGAKLLAQLRRFAEGDARAPDAEHVAAAEVLQSLRGAQDVPEAASVFNKLTSELGQGFNELHKKFHEDFCKKEAYARGAELYAYLQKMLDKSLGEHLALSFKALEVIQDFHNREEERNEYLKNCLFTEEEIAELARAFRKLQPSLIRQGYGYVRGTQVYSEMYLGRQRMVERETAICISILKADLSVGNYQSVAVHAAAIRNVKLHLGEFLADQVNKEIDQALTLLSHELNIMLNTIEGFVSSGMGTEFSFALCRFVAFFHHIGELPAWRPMLQAERARAWRPLCELSKLKKASFDGSCQKHDIGQALAVAEELRGIADLLATRFVSHLQDLQRFRVPEDVVLQELQWLQRTHLGGRELSEYGQYFMTLDVSLTSSMQDVDRNYKRLSKEMHPDKVSMKYGHARAGELQQRLNQAHEVLFKRGGFETYRTNLKNLFQPELQSLPGRLHTHLQELLDEASYTHVAKILQSLADLSRLPLARNEVEACGAKIEEAVKMEVNRVKNSIAGLWERQDFENLQQALSKLKQMAACFGAYPDIFLDDWRTEIRQKIENRLDQDASKAKAYLQGSAEQRDSNIMEFGRQLILLGRVFDHLPDYKPVAIHKVDVLLEECQQRRGGCFFIFKLGGLLDQGKCGDIDGHGVVEAEDQRIGRVIVNEFRHFSNVRTLVWNQQTSGTAQKSLEEVLEDFQHVVKGPKSATVDLKRLRAGFEKYKERCEAHLRSWEAKRLSCEQLAARTIRAAAEVAPKSSQQWSPELRDALPELLAGVSAYFTISKSGESFLRMTKDSKESSSEHQWQPRQLLKQPHKVQILACLRLLHMDAAESALSSHLMQIGTGEGKSILLGCCAVILALLGFQSRCVCYSDYLSARDFDDFRAIFRAFQVEDRIRYSKITQFSEHRALAKGDLRRCTEKLLRNRLSLTPDPAATLEEASAPKILKMEEPCTALAAASAGPKDSEKPQKEEGALLAREEGGLAAASPSEPMEEFEEEAVVPALNGEEVLLVDEVDVFFGQDFYGQTYNQVCLVSLPEVKGLLFRVWAQRSEAGSALARKIRESKEFAALKLALPGWGFVVDTELEAMCFAVREVARKDLESCYEPHYDRATNRIGYKIMDSVDFDVSYGYLTAFHYLQLAEMNKLRDEEEALDHVLQLRVSCGRFSYANFGKPKILGVSGTVKALCSAQWQVLRNYGLDSFTSMPSVYGTTNMKFLDQRFGDPIVLCSRKEHHLSIASGIRTQVEEGRAVIVFFPDAAALQAFEDSQHCKDLRTKSFLRETLSRAEKEHIIKKAAIAGQITLTTAIFGRGTDFFCNDKKLLDAGGAHVMQTFFSLDKCEEVQIMGRTARQGQAGSYGLVLSKEDLSEAGLNCDSHVAPSKLYQLLDASREVHQKQLQQEMDKRLAEADKVDELTHSYFDAALSGNTAAATEKFTRLYKHCQKVAGRGRARLVFLSDATGSMGGLWGAARSGINTMIERVKEIGGDNFEFLWVAYKDYSDPQVIQSSGWTNDAGGLQSFVNSIECIGGGDREEAVEAALLVAHQEHDKSPISRVLLIADAPPHFEKKGQKLTGHAHVLQTDFMVEAQALKQREVPVYCFRVGGCCPTMAAFQQIANATGGAAVDLTPEKLIDVVCTSALMDIGGSSLVAEYKARYG